MATYKSVRHLPYLSWRNDDSWVESMKGPRWNALLRQESKFFRSLTENRSVQKLAKEFKEDFAKIKPFTSQEVFTIGCGSILITLQKSGLFLWRWKWSTKYFEASDIDIVDSNVWYVTESKKDEYDCILLCQTSDDTILWKKHGISSQVAVKDGKCYYIRVKGLFNTVELCVCDALTGKNEKLIYTEPDITHTIGLVTESNRTLYLLSVEASKGSCWRIQGEHLIPIDTSTTVQIPLGLCNGEDCRIIKKTNNSKYELKGGEIKSWILPPESEVLEWVNVQTGHIVTLNEGSRTIWKCVSKMQPYKIFSILAGDIEPNPWSKWENQTVQTFYICSPLEPPYIIHVVNNNFTAEYNTYPNTSLHNQIIEPLVVHKYLTTSLDGTKVPYVIVHQKGFSIGHIQGLLVYGYGAYGASTPVGWPNMTWYPLLKKGWAISYALVRGGGDVNDVWADAATLENRHKSVEDFEAVVRASQKQLSVKPEHTVIYGRSAGGFLVGSTAIRNPTGDLMGAVYTEVPYVDILRTITNPLLPLTQGEYDDFGNPAKSIAVFRETLRISPVNAISDEANGIPDLFVLARTGLKDQQVLAYEPFKWILKLRGKRHIDTKRYHPCGKFIAFEKNQSHVYSINEGFRSRAMDLAILESWRLKKIQPSSIEMNTKRNGGTRKRNNVAGGKRKNGGKRKEGEGGRRRRTIKRQNAGRRRRTLHH